MGFALPAIFIVFGVIASAVCVISLQLRRARMRRLRAWAARHGLRFLADKAKKMHQTYPRLDILQRGHGRFGRFHVTGYLNDWPVHYFDYVYRTGGGKHQQTHRYAVLVVGAPFQLKEMLIRPEGLFDRVKSFFGYDDIDFASAEFSRRFHVSAADRKWAYDVLHARNIELLMTRPHFAIDMDQQWAAIYQRGRWRLHEIEDAFVHLTTLLQAIPGYVARERQQTSPEPFRCRA